LFFIIFLQVTVNLFSKYNIEEITIKEIGKKVVNINKQTFLAPYYKLPYKSNIKIKLNFNNQRKTGKKIVKRNLEGNFFIKKYNNDILLFEKLNLNTYVLGVLNSETSDINTIPTEALKAFYLVIKNYSLTHLKRHKNINADFCDIAHCQLYYGKFLSPDFISPDFIKENIYYKESLAITPYSSSCGEYTCNSKIIWNKEYPYLKGKKLNTVLDKWQYKISKKELNMIIGENSVKKLILEKGCIKGGENFRRKINQKLGWNKVKSNVFTIKENKNYYTIKGSGFGHNVGFCIKEAILLAKRGMNYKEILKYFFNGVKIR